MRIIFQNKEFKELKKFSIILLFMITSVFSIIK